MKLKMENLKKVVSKNPANGEKIAEFLEFGKYEIDNSVLLAKRSFDSWSEVPRLVKSELFDKLANLIDRDFDKLKYSISRETGKSINESHAEVIETKHMFQLTAAHGRIPCGKIYPSELPHKMSYSVRKPKGIIASILPFNFPMGILSWNLGPSILEGNVVVMKPSEHTPYCAYLIWELFQEAGFPVEIFSLVHGSDETGKLLVEHPDVDMILFTGSAETGMKIRQQCSTTWNKQVSCEMGSKSAVMVFGDTNLNMAMDACIASVFKLSGQRCVSSGRILIQRSIYDEFCEEFVKKASELMVGDPFDEPPPYYGPMISEEAINKVEYYNQLVRDSSSSNILVDMGRVDGTLNMGPMIYQTEWDINKKFLVEEVFGPSVALIPFDDVKDAIRIYQSTRFGLALGVLTENNSIRDRIIKKCDAGMIYINGGSIGGESFQLFGGVKASGTGHSTAAGAFDSVSDEINVLVNNEQSITWAQGMK